MSNKNEVVKHEEEQVERVEQKRTYAPPVDIFEDKNEVLMYADMPGVELEDVRIHFEKNQLTMEGRCSCLPDDENDPGFIYTRKFVLPGGINADKISAELSKGVLTVHLPKHDALRPRQISVKAG